MTAGYLYSCKWRTTNAKRIYQGWSMLMYIRKEKPHPSSTYDWNYVFLDMTTGDYVRMDEVLARYCKELNLEKV
tara:strand:- start:181 stop:402 length:222 start_codon:yes stop_codon:yes gene_type:complete